MKREVFVEEMARLMLHFDNDKEKMTALKIENYWEQMKYIPGKAFSRGALKVIQTREYTTFPTVGTLLRASVGDHGHVVTARLPYGRDAQLDDIMSAYKKRWELAEQRKALPDAVHPKINFGETPMPAVVDLQTIRSEMELKDKKIIEELRLENSRLEGQKARLEAEIAEYRERIVRQGEELRRQGEELARLERIHRVK